MKNEITKALGQKLRLYFEKEQITQEELAKEFNTKQSWISRIYRGDFGVRSKIARELCKKANISFLDDSETCELLKESQHIDKISKKLLDISKKDIEVFNKFSSLLEDLKS
ncbi:MAG: helix-turn-helix transcriptional regulator [Alcaligenaceae bacterium]|nr:helix-turn-helix transcriptional regulator [Alcaligenaceae bacterium]